MKTDEEVLKELKVFRRMMKSEYPFRFLTRCIKYGIVRNGGWIDAARSAPIRKTKEVAREFFLADLLED